MGITFDSNTIKLISMFESITRARVKDCFDNKGTMVFIVEEGDIGKALGKKAVNVRKIENMLKKKIRVIEYSTDITKFVRNVIMPNKANEITYEEGIITITPTDPQSRGYLIGRAAEILRNNESIVKKYYKDLKEIKVV